MHCGYSSGNVKRISWHCHGSVVTFRSLHSFAPWRCHSRNSRFMMSIHHRLGPCEGKGCVTVSDSVICAAIVHLTFTQTAKSSYGSISDLFAKNWNRSKLLSCIQKLVLTHTHLQRKCYLSSLSTGFTIKHSLLCHKINEMHIFLQRSERIKH